MSEIPDDVVERIWRDLCEKLDRTSPAEHLDMVLVTLDELRAALRVGVEWEREQCAKVAENSRCQTVGDKRRADAIAATIRARDKSSQP